MAWPWPGRVLDWADRRGGYWPSLAGLVAGFGLGQLMQGHRLALVLLVPGLIMIALRPGGTTVRQLMRDRQERLMARAEFRDLCARYDADPAWQERIRQIVEEIDSEIDDGPEDSDTDRGSF